MHKLPLSVLYSCLVLFGCSSSSPDSGDGLVSGGSTSSQAGTSTNTGGSSAAGTTTGIGGLVVTPAEPGNEETRALPECVSCEWASCADGKKTTISGVVRTPALLNADPLYNAVVYVPGAALEPFPETVSCDRCGNVSGKPLAATLSGSDGTFTLEDVPAGEGVPLVLQMGRWRRQVVMPEIVACQDNPLPADLTRFPRNRGEGDIPRIALVSSSYDPEECILRKMGIDDAEFTLPSEPGRVHLFQGNGASLGSDTPTGAELWSDAATLARYDMVMLPCGSTPENAFGFPQVSGPAARGFLADYADAGGRVFATDLSYTWLTSTGSPFGATAQWVARPDRDEPHDTLPSSIDTTFPKGQALAEWLQNIGATTTAGEITLHETYRRSLAVNAPTQRWLYSPDPATLQSFTFNTPISAPAEEQCGRFAYSSFHIAGATDGFEDFPAECNDEPLTPQERVLEFMLFDLASCVQIDTSMPKPPIVPK
jgi:hypothetical protein